MRPFSPYDSALLVTVRWKIWLERSARCRHPLVRFVLYSLKRWTPYMPGP